MIHRLRKEGIVYILVFCFNQIIVADVNPFGIAVAAASISSGYLSWPIYLMTILASVHIYTQGIISNILSLCMLSIFEFILKKYNKKLNYNVKTVIFMCIYAIVKISLNYNELNFLRGFILIMEIIVVISSYLVLSVGVNYIVNRDISKEMNIQEKISISLLITLLGIYIIQVRDNSVTPFKIIVIYILSFIGTLIYKLLKDMKNNKNYKYGQVYNNLVYNKLSNYSEVVRKMAKSINLNPYNYNLIKKEQESIIFEKISEKYCATCDRCNYCWNKEFDTTYEAANIMMSVGIENGILTMPDVPRSFVVRCKKIKDIIETTNINLEIARNNMWWHSKMNELKNIMSMQLKELSKTMRNFSQNMYNNVYLESSEEKKIRYALKDMGVSVRDLYYYDYRGVKEIIMTVKTRGTKIKTNDVAAEISYILKEGYKVGEFAPRVINNKIVEVEFIKEEKYHIRSSGYSLKKYGEEYCGDNFTIMNEDIAEEIFVLSDGMGCGINAYKESKKVIEMVEEFIGAGFSKEITINLLNLSMYMNNIDGKFSTLDMCGIDRYTGRCSFIKIGAAPTFIKRGKEVYEIKSNTLPIGVFDKMDYYEQEFQLQDKDVVIMMSDGLGDSMNRYLDWKEKLISIISLIDVYNPKLIVENILKQGINSDYIVDDITILVAVVWNNNN